MRYDTKVAFVRETPGEYSERTGDYGAGSTSVTEGWANVTDTGEETLRLVYGQIKQGAKTIRLRGTINADVDYVIINDDDSRKYVPDVVHTYRQEQVFVCSEKP